MLPAPPALPVTRVSLSPEAGRDLAVPLHQPHLTEPQPSQRLEAAGRESRMCLMALCALPRQAAPAGSQPLLVMSCTDTPRACTTLSAHLQDNWRHSGWLSPHKTTSSTQPRAGVEVIHGLLWNVSAGGSKNPEYDVSKQVMFCVCC